MTASRPNVTPLCVMALLGFSLIVTSTGCQVSSAGQTLPSPSYSKDNVQYHPDGPEFKLSREAAAMKAYREEAASQR